MSYGTTTVQVHKKLRLDKRKGSDNWYARLTLENGKRQVKSTGTDNLDEAKELALAFYYETQARIKNKLPATTRKFKHVADFAIQRMESELEAGSGKQSYKDYISALNRCLVPYFGNTDISKIDLAGLTAFDEWRTATNKKPFSQSGINNHNSALNRVFDEAELHGWLVKSMRPTLLNKGVKTESRGSFTVEEYRKIYTKLRSFHKETKDKKAAATRETLRNYLLFLANTGIRHGKEALNIRWRNIAWHVKDDEKYLAISVDGKTNKRTTIARDKVPDFLLRQSKLNPNISVTDFDGCCQTNANQSLFSSSLNLLGCAETAPLGQSGGAVQLEV
jgi:integrase